MSTVPFTPTQIPNCILWFDAADTSTIITSGTTVTRWNSKGTLNVFASNVPALPRTEATGTLTTGFAFTTSTSNVIRSLNNSYMGISNVVQTQKSRVQAFIFSVTNFGDGYAMIMNSADWTGTHQFGFNAWNRDGNSINTYPAGFGAEYMGFGGIAPYSGTLPYTGVPFVVVWRHSTTLASNYMSVNGTNIIPTSVPPAGSAALVNGYFTGTSNFVLGTGPYYGNTQLLGEIIQYDGEISNLQLQQIEGYLSWKWGNQSQLPATHPYKNFAPTGTTILPTVEVNFINANTIPGTITLPSSFTFLGPGRPLIFKDWYGAFSTNAMTLTTNNSNQGIDGATNYSIVNNTRLGWNSVFAGNNNRWYTVGGTVLNSLDTSTITTTALSSFQISSAVLSVRTAGFVNQFTSTNTLYAQSTFLFYRFGNQSSIISGTRQSFGQVFLLAARSFLPNQIAALTLWLDASDPNTIQTTNNVVTSWRDKSGGARNTTTIGGSPVYNPNTRTIALNGTSTYFVGPYVNTTTFLTAFVVATVNFSLGNYGAFYRLLSVGSTAANDYNNVAYAAVILHQPNTTNIGGYRNVQQNYVSVVSNNTFILCQQYDNSTGTNYLNGTQGGQVASSGTFNTSSYSIGRDVGNTDGTPPTFAYTYWPGTISEVLIYNASLTVAQRQQVEGYLAWKWGLVANLPSSHPFKNSPP